MISDLVGSLCLSQQLTFWGLHFTEEGGLCFSCCCGLHLFFWLVWLIILTFMGCPCSDWLAPSLRSGSGLRTVSGSRAEDELRGMAWIGSLGTELKQFICQRVTYLSFWLEWFVLEQLEKSTLVLETGTSSSVDYDLFFWLVWPESEQLKKIPGWCFVVTLFM